MTELQDRHLIAPGPHAGHAVERESACSAMASMMIEWIPTMWSMNRRSGNGKIDPSQSLSGEMITAPGYDRSQFDHDGGTRFDHDGIGTPGQPDDKRARQHYAQQLYLLLDAAGR